MRPVIVALTAVTSLVRAFNLDDVLPQQESVQGHHVAEGIIKRADTVSPGYIAPSTLGGNMDMVFEGQPDTKPEPINIILSGNSSFGSLPGATNEQILNSPLGLSQYLSALNISDECLGLHLSTPAYAKVSGSTGQVLDFLYRENFGDYPSGTCHETVVGGYHFRGWRQRESQAWFLAGSLEQNLTQAHAVSRDGYNLGRNAIIERAKRGGSDYNGCHWPAATVTSISGLAQADAGGPRGRYHHEQGIDGLVALITVGEPQCDKDAATTKAPPIKIWTVPGTNPTTTKDVPTTTTITTTTTKDGKPASTPSAATHERPAIYLSIASLVLLFLLQQQQKR